MTLCIFIVQQINRSLGNWRPTPFGQLGLGQTFIWLFYFEKTQIHLNEGEKGSNVTA